MMKFDMPTFDHALEQFQAFIASQGHSADLLWIFREDVVERQPHIYLHMPLSDDIALVQRMYATGVRRGLGVQLEVFCFWKERPCCYIWLPQDAEDANYRMLSALKLSVPTDPERRIVVPVKSRLRWMWLKAYKSRKSNWTWADQLPRRLGNKSMEEYLDNHKKQSPR